MKNKENFDLHFILFSCLNCVNLTEPAAPPLGWSDFERKNAIHSLLCKIVVGPQFQNFMGFL